MVNDDSPIKDYYPIEFHTDLNGKMQEWEAVVLIPFIDEDRLLTAMREKSDQLMKEVTLTGIIHVQWNLKIMDALRWIILSIIEMLSSLWRYIATIIHVGWCSAFIQRCPLFRVSFIGGSTVYMYTHRRWGGMSTVCARSIGSTQTWRLSPTHLPGPRSSLMSLTAESSQCKPLLASFKLPPSLSPFSIPPSLLFPTPSLSLSLLNPSLSPLSNSLPLSPFSIPSFSPSLPPSLPPFSPQSLCPLSPSLPLPPSSLPTKPQ